MPGLPLDRLDAVVFDTDGVLTDTARVHAAAWARLFDDYLERRAACHGERFRPFTEADYLRHVDGRPRYDGVAAFLASRGIVLPWGDPADPPDRETVCGLGKPRTASSPRSTGSRPPGLGCPASPTRRCSWRRPGGSGATRAGPRSRRTLWPGSRPAAGAGSGWSSESTVATRPRPGRARGRHRGRRPRRARRRWRPGPAGRPVSAWTLAYDGFDRPPSGSGRRCAPLATATSRPAGPPPRPPPPTSTTPAPTPPGSTTGRSAGSRAARSRTRTWSTCPTGCP